MFGCKCCRCSKSIESLDLQKPHTEVLSKREKLSEAQAKSYKKLRLSSFIPESYFVNGQQLNNQTMNVATSSHLDQPCSSDQETNVKKATNLCNLNATPYETKPKLAFTPIQQSIYEEEAVNEAETLIGANTRTIDKTSLKKKKRPANFEQLDIYNSTESLYQFDYNLYSIKKNISVWCIDIALLTSNGQMLKNILNKGYHHLSYFFDKPNSDLFMPDNNELLISNSNSTLFANTTIASASEEEELRKKYNDLWSFYMFMFNLSLVLSSIVLQLLVGILLLINTKSNKKQPRYPSANAECYNHTILAIILFITVINVFIVVFVGETT